MTDTLSTCALDNCAVIVEQRDKHAVWALFERMGFKLHPLGRQHGPLADHGDVQHGTGSRTINFKVSGYFEMIGIEESDRPSPSRYPERLAEIGSHMAKVTIGVPDADATCAALEAMGEPGASPSHVGRKFVRENGALQECKFYLFRYPGKSIMDLQLIGGQHLTPNVTWQPDLLEHENGTVVLAAAGMVSNDPEALRAGFAKLLSLDESSYLPDGGLQLGGGTRLEIHKPDHYSWTQRPIELPENGGAMYSEVVFGVESLDKTRARLKKGDIAFIEADDSILVDLTGFVRTVFRFIEWRG